MFIFIETLKTQTRSNYKNFYIFSLKNAWLISNHDTCMYEEKIIPCKVHMIFCNVDIPHNFQVFPYRCILFVLLIWTRLKYTSLYEDIGISLLGLPVKYHRRGGLNNTHVFLRAVEAEVQIKVWASLAFRWPPS